MRAKILRHKKTPSPAADRRPASHAPLIQQKAFTLVEMMVVLFIIVLLATLVLPVVFKSWGRAARRQAQAECRVLVLAAKAYYNTFNKWPAQISAADVCFFTNNHVVVTQLMGHNPLGRSFINIPTNALDSRSNYLDPEGIPYIICINQSGQREQIAVISNVVYTNERTGLAINYTVRITNQQTVVAAAFMEFRTNLAVNSWSDF